MNFFIWIISLNIPRDSSMSHVYIACIFALRHSIDLVCAYVCMYVFMCAHIHMWTYISAYKCLLLQCIDLCIHSPIDEILIPLLLFLISSYYDKGTTMIWFMSFCVYVCDFLVALQVSLDFLGHRVCIYLL